jgi:hypothetical protein
MESIFFRLLKAEDKETTLQRCLADLRVGRDNELTHTVRQATFALLPGSPMPYWVSDVMRQKFKDLPPFEGNGGVVQRGLSTPAYERFIRLRWEIPQRLIGKDKRWTSLAKGGEYSPYYDDIHLLVEWADKGKAIKTYLVENYPFLKGRYEWYVTGESYYFQSGLNFPLRTVKGFNVRIMPAGCIFANVGSAIFSNTSKHKWYNLGLLNSRCIQQFLLMMTASRSWDVGIVRALPYQLKKTTDHLMNNLAAWAQICHNLKRDLDRSSETSHTFTQPTLLGLKIANLEILIEDLTLATQNLTQRFLDWLIIQEAAEVQIIENSYRIDQTVLDLYDISMRDRCTIDRELGPHPGSYPPQETWTEEDDEKLRLLYLTKEFLPDEAEADSDDEAGDNGQPAQRRTSRRTTYRTLEEVAQALQVHPASVAARRLQPDRGRPDLLPANIRLLTK